MSIILTQCGLLSASPLVINVTTLADDSFIRANNTTSLGTADIGGVWTAQQFTWGIFNNRAYCPGNVAGALATLTVSQPPRFIQSTLITTDIAHPMAIVPRFVNTGQVLQITFKSGVVRLISGNPNSGTERINVPAASAGLPTTGPSTFTAGCTIDQTTFAVQLYVNGVAVGSPYTLSPTEISTYGSVVKIGMGVSSAIPGATNQTISNFLATT